MMIKDLPLPALLTLSVLVCTALALTPPTLPSSWVSTTIDPPEPTGVEAYKFVDDPYASASNPSAMWSNYTDCKRLIWYTGSMNDKRYLLGCDAVDCCYEEQDTNQVEFQIPDVHPASLTKVQYGGQKNITVFGETILADAWEWKFNIEHTVAYTTPCNNCVNNITLRMWQVEAAGETAIIQFKNYRGIFPQNQAAFDAQFTIPAVCQPNPLSCDGFREKGLLRPAFPEDPNWALLRKLAKRRRELTKQYRTA